MNKLTITHPNQEDRAAWAELFQGYARFYKVETNKSKMDVIWSWIHDDNEAFWCLLAKNEQGKAVGLMHYREMPSPLRGTKVGFLDDLFVDPNERGSGIVDALFEKLNEEAKRQYWPIIRWLTADDNYRARAVYDKLATRSMFLTYQMEVK